MEQVQGAGMFSESGASGLRQLFLGGVHSSALKTPQTL